MDLLPQDTRLRLTEEERRYLRRHSPRLLSTLSVVKSLPVKSVLDIGSGSGVFLLLLPPAWRRVAVDSSLNADLAKKAIQSGTKTPVLDIGLDVLSSGGQALIFTETRRS